jgi:amino acid transporter
MVWAFLLNIPFAFGLLLSYLFSMPDVDGALGSPTGFPFIYVFRQAVKNTAGAAVLVVIILVLIVMITISSLASASRQTFAFARDNGLPFSSWLAAVSLFQAHGPNPRTYRGDLLTVCTGSSNTAYPGQLNCLYMPFFVSDVSH